MIREALREDIPVLVEIYTAALPDDLPVRLGMSFLRQTFWPVVISSPNAFALVHVDQDQVDSFVLFAYQGEKLSADLMQHRGALARGLLVRFFSDPDIAIDALARLKGFRLELDSPESVKEDQMAELYLIATTPGFQGRGIGSLLVKAGLERLAGRGRDCLVKTASGRSRQFYLKNGFVDVGREFRGRRTLYVMRGPPSVNTCH